MVVKTSTGKPTKIEADRIDDFRRVGCIACRSTLGVFNPSYDVHHIVRGNRRLGHWFTIPLCPQHHRYNDKRGEWTSIAHGSRAFERVHGSELQLWQKTQYLLGLSQQLPSTLTSPSPTANGTH